MRRDNSRRWDISSGKRDLSSERWPRYAPEPLIALPFLPLRTLAIEHRDRVNDLGGVWSRATIRATLTRPEGTAIRLERLGQE